MRAQPGPLASWCYRNKQRLPFSVRPESTLSTASKRNEEVVAGLLRASTVRVFLRPDQIPSVVLHRVRSAEIERDQVGRLLASKLLYNPEIGMIIQVSRLAASLAVRRPIYH